MELQLKYGEQLPARGAGGLSLPLCCAVPWDLLLNVSPRRQRPVLHWERAVLVLVGWVAQEPALTSAFLGFLQLSHPLSVTAWLSAEGEQAWLRILSLPGWGVLKEPWKTPESLCFLMLKHLFVEKMLPHLCALTPGRAGFASRPYFSCPWPYLEG